MEKLIKEYRDTLGGLKEFKKKKANTLPNELTPINSMIYDTSWTIKYMETGREPDENRKIHSREIPVDPHLLKDILANKQSPSYYGPGYTKGMFREAHWILNNILTPRERDAFILIKVSLYSYSKAGVKMGCSKSAVESFMSRAKNKLKKYFEGKGTVSKVS